MEDTGRTDLFRLDNAWRILWRDLGISEIEMYRRARISVALAEEENPRVDRDGYFRLCAVFEEMLDDSVPLRLGQSLSVDMFDPALFAAICSPNMTIAGERLGIYKQLTGPFSLDVDRGPDRTRFVFRCQQRVAVPFLLAMVESVFSVHLVRHATRHRVVPLSVEVPRLPEDPAPYESYFGCRMQEGDGCVMTLSARDATRPFLTANSAMWKTFEPSLQRRLSELVADTPMQERVAAALFELLPSGRAQMADAAKALGLGTRTLQRRLLAEGKSYIQVLNETRDRLARYYLTHSAMSTAEISFLLGFDDPNSLFRAFNRWNGTSPEAWRALHRPARSVSS